MNGAPASFGARLKALREAAGFTQEELAAIAGLSVHAVSALERGERRRPHPDTVRALSAALDLAGPAREAFVESARTAVPAPAADDQGRTPLPLPLTGLIGRDADVETLRRWLADAALRLVTLVGPGGVGKTRLALALAHAIQQEGAAHVRFVSLAAVRDHRFVSSAIAEALGLTDASAAELPKRARAACGDRPMLLVLDNFEQVLGAASLVAELLTSAASLRFLITSREPLRVRGEREYVLGPLDLEAGFEAMSLAALAQAPAVRLFVERVRDAQHDFRLTPANAPSVAAICRRLDALPLALELAAPWIKVLSPEDLLRRLERDALLLPAGPRDLPERQQTMNATVGWSYRLLDAEEQRAFRRLGVIPGLFPIDAAEAVLAGADGSSSGGDAIQRVRALVDKSLLQRSETSAVATCPLYLMLDTMRAYAMHELVGAGERDDALEGLSRYCAGEASLAAEGLVGSTQTEWLDRVREDLDSYRVSLAWLIEHRRAAEASRIASALLFFWLIRGHAGEGLRWYEQILSLPSLAPDAEARALLGAAAMSHAQGELERARILITRALELSRGLACADLVAQASWMRGHVEFATGNRNQARDWFAQSLEAFETLAIPWGIGSASSGLAWVALAAGDADEADRLVHQATSALRSAGPWFLALGSYIRVVLALRRGNTDEVIALMRQSLTRVRDLQDRFAVLYGLVPLAVAAALRGNDAWAARILGTRDAIMERTGLTLVDPSLRGVHEQAERRARARLGADRWARAYAEGRACSVDALLEDITGVLA